MAHCRGGVSNTGTIENKLKKGWRGSKRRYNDHQSLIFKGYRMLTAEQMLSINQGYLVTHSDYSGVWVVMEREHDMIRVQEVNECTSSWLSLSVDDEDLNIYHLY